MFDHYDLVYPFKDHPLIFKMKEELARLNADDCSMRFLAKHTVFMYPRVLSFSFQEYPENFSNFMKRTDSSSDTSLIINGLEACSFPLLYSKLSYITFFQVLMLAIEKLSLSFVILLDLRHLRLYDESMLLTIAETIKTSAVPHTIMILANQPIYDTIKSTAISNLAIIHLTCSEFFAHISKHVIQSSHSVTFDSKITLTSLESQIDSSNLYANLYAKYLADFDFTKAPSISFFSTCMINLFIHTIGHEYGVLSAINDNSVHHKVTSSLHSYRSFLVSKLFLLKDSKVESTGPYLDSFGIYLFNHSHRKNLLSRFDSYLFKIRSENSSYMDSYVSVKYAHKSQTKKPTIYRLTFFNIISSVVHELVENAIIHSEGTGYLAASLSADRGHLQIFIGDTGIGLKKGILKNYRLDDLIIDESKSLLYLFNLSDFKDRRKERLAFNIGAGEGLRDTLCNIFACNGRFAFRTLDLIGSFMNPVSKTFLAPKMTPSNISVLGCQYMLVFPVSDKGQEQMPKSTEEFLRL